VRAEFGLQNCGCAWIQ